MVLDGDALRRGLNSDLGFSAADRSENLRRTAEVALLMADAGLVVIMALISPYRSDREKARRLFQPGRFIQVFIETPLSMAEARDPKGLYKRARQGLLPGTTGIDAPYAVLLAPECSICTTEVTATQAGTLVVARVT